MSLSGTDAPSKRATYVLYFSPGSTSMAPHTVLAEIGVPFELRRVQLEDGRVRDEDFAKVNPIGKIPALAVDGVVIGEAAAICMFLADRHPEARLAPAKDALARGKYYQWMAYLTNTMQVAFMRTFFPNKFSNDEQHADAIKASAEQDVAKGWKLVERQLMETPYLIGDERAACDLFLFMLYSWLETPLDAATHPHVVAWAERTRTRPGVQRMLEQNEMA